MTRRPRIADLVAVEICYCMRVVGARFEWGVAPERHATLAESEHVQQMDVVFVVL